MPVDSRTVSDYKMDIRGPRMAPGPEIQLFYDRRKD